MPDQKVVKKGGPLGLPMPVVIVGGLLVMYLLYRWYENNQAANAANAANAATTATTPASDAGSAVTNLGGTVSGTGAFSSFTDWFNAIQNWGNSLGYDPAQVQNALQAYQGGQCLTLAQYNIIDQAIGQFGSPPDAPTTGIVQCAQTTTTSPTNVTTNPVPVLTESSGTPVPDPSVLQGILDQEVGALSTRLNINSGSTNIAAAAASLEQSQSWTTPQFAQQQVNVGLLSQQVRRLPTQAQILQQSYSLAGGQQNFASLPTLQQNQSQEIANVQLINQMN